MKKINIFILLNLIFVILFSLLNICFTADVSCVAFLLSIVYSALTFYFLGIEVYKRNKKEKIFASRKILQYQPYVLLIAFIFRRAGEKGTNFAFDLISVLLWLCVFVTSLCLSHFFDPKYFNKISDEKIKDVKNESITKMFAKGKTRDGSKVTGLNYIKWFIFEILDWADALVQAVFMVLLFQIFFFQFYKIPSESMVPEYMINDRVAVSKITSGPKFPLSDVGLPCLKTYNRGDIVVFRNPHYSMDRKSEVKSVVSQLVYMLTFTFVNTNVDEHGLVKADPLVKRITGVAGEQLMMQDGILYARTAKNPVFTPVTEDSKWAAYNLNDETPELKSYIQDFRVSNEIFSELTGIEAERNSLDFAQYASECRRIADIFKANVKSPKIRISDDELLKLFGTNDLFEYVISQDCINFAQRIISIPEGAQWFEAFMTDWITKYDGLIKDSFVGGNRYDDANFRLNLMLKYYLGTFVAMRAENLSKGMNEWTAEQESYVVYLGEKIRQIHNYIVFLDSRNMPVFPANDENGNPQFIPEGCYFMMGDNRFNSFDMRHTDNRYFAKLSPFDNYSVTYYSAMKPMYVPKKLILGSAGVRFWPLKRPVRKAR